MSIVFFWRAAGPQRPRLTSGLVLLAFGLASGTAPAQTWTVGMTAAQQPLEAVSVPAQESEAPHIVVIGGLSGDRASSTAVDLAYEAYVNSANNHLDVSFLPRANPGADRLTFPPVAPAYGGDPTAWSLWQFLTAHAPDAVFIVGGDEFGLGPALAAGLPGLGTVPYLTLDYENEVIAAIDGPAFYPRSGAREALQARLARSPASVAAGLAASYGQSLGPLTYIPGMALIGRLRLGQVAEVEAVVRPQLDNIAAMEIDNSLEIAGHLLLAELAERTGNARYLALARRAADLGFSEDGRPLEAMPFHGEYSDAFFMATPLLAKVGKLTGEARYFDLAERHVDFLAGRLLRPDGLYNHWPRAEAAWGRGNAFVLLGLALALSDIPETQAAHARLLARYRDLATTLLPHVDVDGLWHNVIDVKGSFAELSATAMIATALQRGVDRGWLEPFHQGVVDRAWEGVVARTDADWGFLDVCESTPGQDSLDAYLGRRAISGRDERAGGMMLLFATERLQPR